MAGAGAADPRLSATVFKMAGDGTFKANIGRHPAVATNPGRGHSPSLDAAERYLPAERLRVLTDGDPQRLLPEPAPFGRLILMGAGTFLELLAMAAAKRGHRAEVSLFPDGEPGGPTGRPA